MFVGIYNGSAAVENSTESPQCIKNETTINPEILLVRIYLKELKLDLKEILSTSMVTVAIFTETTCCKQMDKNVIYTWNTVLFSFKRE